MQRQQRGPRSALVGRGREWLVLGFLEAFECRKMWFTLGFLEALRLGREDWGQRRESSGRKPSSGWLMIDVPGRAQDAFH